MGAQGTVLLNFGAFPGTTDATVAVTGQTGILSGSLVEAWILPTATADHTADEHWVEELQVFAGGVVAGTGFTVYGVHRPASQAVDTGQGTLLNGAYTIAWVWN
jgi:hypothetical protein